MIISFIENCAEPLNINEPKNQTLESGTIFWDLLYFHGQR